MKKKSPPNVRSEARWLNRLWHNITIMGRTIKGRLKRRRAQYWRLMRLLFSSPAELRLIELMGGKIWRVGWPRRNGFGLAFVVNRGKLFRQEKVRREVFVGGRYFVDFCNDVGRVIEVDGKQHDIVSDFDRDAYLYSRGFQVLRIPAIDLYNNSAKTQRRVIAFLTK